MLSPLSATASTAAWSCPTRDPRGPPCRLVRSRAMLSLWGTKCGGPSGLPLLGVEGAKEGCWLAPQAFPFACKSMSSGEIHFVA